MKRATAFLMACVASSALAQTRVPTFEEVISLRSVGGVALSPDGKNVAFTVQTTDWTDNRFDTEVWLSRNGGKPFQLTNTAKNSSTSPAFSPNGEWIAFLTDRGNKNQIHLIRTEGGEARAITKEEEGISSFDWHPSGNSIVFLKPEKESKSKKERDKRYGGFEVDDKEYTLSHLWVVEVKPDIIDPTERPCYESADSLKTKAGCIEFPSAKRLTEGAFTVTGFAVSPDGASVVFNHQPDPLINSFVKSDISLVDIASKKVTQLVTNPSSDSFEDWSPDSKEILFTTNLSDTVSNFYVNSKLFAVTIATKSTRPLAQTLDEDLGGFTWETTGIYGSLWNKTKRPLYRIDPTNGLHTVIKKLPDQVFGISFAKDGQTFAFTGRGPDQLTEAFMASTTSSPRQFSDLSGQLSGWKIAQSEVISWKSKDGATIEGVLHKPANYDPSKKYPLLVMIHGGP
ncbi:MAG: S9 family peptidase, partial [Cyclobacteriaceae bacterium]|nr:S9 family peptidase [Cyclobacteriaceae bacterium]